MGCSFVTSPVVIKTSPALKRRRSSRCHAIASASDPHHQPTPSTQVPRREVLLTIASTSISAALIAAAPLGSAPALADRTGKYSTKLTAKRRYLPRIERDLAAFAALGGPVAEGAAGWDALVADFVAGPADDAERAMPLFSTTFFSEGNKIGPIEKELKEIEDALFASWKAMGRAAKKGNRDAANEAFNNGVARANQYLQVAKLTEVIPLIEV